jgi:hypothetical protein
MSVSTAAPSRARLYYERRGSGPLLLLIGSPMDSVGFAPLASALADRYTKAMQKFLAHAGLGAGPAQEADAPQWAPSTGRLARMRATTDQFLAHLLRPTTRYRPDIEALRAASTRIVVAAGATSKGQLPNRTAVALADQLGTTVVDLPGDHGGFLAFPEQFGRVLDQVLTERT